ncbi:MAG: site-specific DNA-methyltransferase [Chloroflexota bacterium]|nr:site-specific DNA-methyltransferase [Chloroflexota bacterium]
MITQSYAEQFNTYLNHTLCRPLFLRGDALTVLSEFPSQSIDFCMTSPPYWNKREYHNGGIGLETTYEEYTEDLLKIFSEVKRVLKNSGSFWLNLGDTYHNKELLGIPWRIAIKMMDEQKWELRNDVIWNKLKGPDNSKDKLRNIHEYVFHFVKQTKDFYYDINSIRSKPREVQIKNGAIISATGVTGIRYKRQLELSTALSEAEKATAFEALNTTLERLKCGEISDFRMVIRNQQRTTHSNSEALSGRAKELVQKGFYFLYYHPDGSKPSDVWEIIPEDTTNRVDDHYAAYPEDLCKIPLLATCPPDGVALDPFCGIGTTNYVAKSLFRKSIGIDLSEKYIDYAERRCNTLF